MSADLEKEFKYYLEHQDELVAKYDGKVLVIKDCTVIGVYENSIEAILTTQKTIEPGTFIVQKCSPGNKDYTATCYSRVRLPSCRTSNA